MSRSAVSTPLSSDPTDQVRQGLTRSFDIQGLRLTTDGVLLVIDGEVPCYRVKKRAGVAARRLVGALEVVNRLRVVPQSHRRDTELAKAVRVALENQASLANEGIAVSVCDGIVTLQGRVVSPAVRCEAESVTWAMRGVVDVENQVRVRRLPARNDQGR